MDEDFRDGVLLAMLEHPDRAHEIARWAASASPDEIASFVDDASGHHHGDDGRFASGGGGAAKSKFGKLLDRVASVPKAVKDKAASFVTKTYAKLKEKYGPTGAKLVLGGMIALLPTPIPGSSFLPVALAEGIKRLRGVVGFAEFAGEPISDEQAELARQLIHDFYAELGETPPELEDAETAGEEAAAFTEGGPDSGACFR